MFTLRTGTVMEGSKLGYQVWVIAIYALTTNLKGVSAMKLHRNLEISYKPAWHLMHRLRKAFESDDSEFDGPVEVDEAYFGGRESNKHAGKKLRAGRGAVGKVPVVGAKDRGTNRIRANVVGRTDRGTLHGFVDGAVRHGARVYTDEAAGYRGMKGVEHEAVAHSVGEYVRGQAHTNGIESFWSMMKRAHMGTFHKISPKHLDRYVQEFAGRHNGRNLDTLAMMGRVARGMRRKRLKYRALIADNGLDSGARGE